MTAAFGACRAELSVTEAELSFSLRDLLERLAPDLCKTNPFRWTTQAARPTPISIHLVNPPEVEEPTVPK